MKNKQLPTSQHTLRDPTSIPEGTLAPNARNPAISAGRHEVFLRELAIDGNVTRSASVAGCDRSGLYQFARAHPEFADCWNDALDRAIDSLEAEARRRAIDGVEEVVYYQGVECGRVRKYSDSLLALLLRGNRAKYRDSGRVEVANAPGEVLRVQSPVEIARQIAFALAAGLRATKSDVITSDDRDEVAALGFER